MGVTGYIEAYNYTDTNGETKFSCCVVARSVEFLTPKANASPAEYTAQPSKDPYTSSSAPSPSPSTSSNTFVEVDDGDLPF